MHVISAHEIMFLHDVFQHHCKSLCNQQYIFLYQNNANRKTGGGLGGNGRGNSHDLKILEKTGGEPGGGRDQWYYREDFAKSTSMICEH